MRITITNNRPKIKEQGHVAALLIGKRAIYEL
jgi:hypothetical protein